MAKKSLEATLATLEETEVETPEAEPDYMSEEEIVTVNVNEETETEDLLQRLDQLDKKIEEAITLIKEILGKRRSKYQRRSLLPKGKE
uniref:Uncharacterized protein n=1 Tax=viral metagenome TaxID=1070528 RepID=A0A6M3M5L1_9ZZZZ